MSLGLGSILILKRVVDICECISELHKDQSAALHSSSVLKSQQRVLLQRICNLDHVLFL